MKDLISYLVGRNVNVEEIKKTHGSSKYLLFQTCSKVHWQFT